jgi:hypothetical protein
MQSAEPTKKNSWRTLLFSRGGIIVLLGIIIVIAVALPFTLVKTTRDQALAETDYSRTVIPNQAGKFVVEVISTNTDNSLNTRILTRNSDGSYTRTQQLLTLTWNEQQVTLGTKEDVKKDAILQVKGPVDAQGIMHSNHIVVFTNSVTVH